jgi:hypothetical protein
MPALAVEDEQGMVDVLAVVAVVEGAFLIFVSGIVRRVKVHEHPLRGTVLLPLREVKLEEDLGYPVARAPRGRVLHPGDGRLAGEIGAALG